VDAGAVILSVNEVEAMVLRAARGAGVPLGHAEDLARAAARVAVVAPGALGELDLVLRGPFAPAGDVARVALEGPVLIDRVLVAGAALRVTVDGPALLAAMAAEAGVVATVDGAVVALQPGALAGGVPAGLAPGPVAVDPGVWGRLGALAARTYVPESEASRRHGAGTGAGTPDND
jgi:hypothetical protein